MYIILSQPPSQQRGVTAVRSAQSYPQARAGFWQGVFGVKAAPARQDKAKSLSSQKYGFANPKSQSLIFFAACTFTLALPDLRAAQKSRRPETPAPLHFAAADADAPFSRCAKILPSLVDNSAHSAQP
jgi:hypothetical protein